MIGLDEFGKGFRIAIINRDRYSAYKRVLRYLIDYVHDCKPKLCDGQTIAYYSWLLKFVHEKSTFYDIWEASSDGNGFVPGVEYSVQTISDQERICSEEDALPLFPSFGQYVAISAGVMEGRGVTAVRYPSPDHMTGWWLTTDLFNDNIDTLETVHFFHVAFNRPDILKYLALPNGFRFATSETDCEIWFDEDAAK